jgi:hypothetical protein
MTTASSSAATSMVIAFCYGWMAFATPTGFPRLQPGRSERQEGVGWWAFLSLPTGTTRSFGRNWPGSWAGGCDLRYIKPKSSKPPLFAGLVLRSRICEGKIKISQLESPQITLDYKEKFRIEGVLLKQYLLCIPNHLWDLFFFILLYR